MSNNAGHIAVSRQPSKRIVATLLSFIQITVVALLLAWLLKSFVVDAIYVPSQSMQSTLMMGDFVFVNKMVYGAGSPDVPFLHADLSSLHFPKFRSVSRGDVIVFKLPDAGNADVSHQPVYFVKRCIAVGGDEVTIRNGVVYVNGVPTSLPDDASTIPTIGADFGPVTVPQHYLFVLGDNRSHSYDSRYWGLLPENNVIGEAMMVYWSVDQLSGIRWDRVGTLIR